MSDSSLHITEAAIQKVHTLLLEAEDASLKLRVFISGGGCSGFQYGFVFEEKAEADDYLIEKHCLADSADTLTDSTVSFIVDPISYAYLKGATIDYREDLQGAQFVIKQNPNAKTTCGCGHSFVPKGQ